MLHLSGPPRPMQALCLGSFSSRNLHYVELKGCSSNRKIAKLPTCIRCSTKDDRFDPSSVERPPYYSYMDSTSGQLEPASGARASIPGREYWPEGTANRVNAARAPEPIGISKGKPSYGKKPGSRRRKYKGRAATSESTEASTESTNLSTTLESSDDASDESKEPSEEYVIYQTEVTEENLSKYEWDKKLGSPHPFVDPAVKKPIEEPRTSDELWWNWRKPEKEQWSRWQRRRPDVDTVFAKAMAETGQIKLYGDQPTLTEAALARARKQVFKEERLQAEQRRLEEIGPIAYYSEWVKAWTRDTSREAVRKHYEETGEDENTQLQTMFQYQTAEEYRIMMGRDVRIQRDPLAMRMREDQIKEIWGGDPVYPTVNYIQDPDEVIDYRGPDFHEPTPNMLAYLMEDLTFRVGYYDRVCYVTWLTRTYTISSYFAHLHGNLDGLLLKIQAQYIRLHSVGHLFSLWHSRWIKKIDGRVWWLILHGTLWALREDRNSWFFQWSCRTEDGLISFIRGKILVWVRILCNGSGQNYTIVGW